MRICSINGQRFLRASNRSRNCCARTPARASRLSSSIISIAASAARQASGLPPKSCGVGARLELFGYFWFRNECSASYAAGQRFGQRHQIGLNIPVLEGKPFTRAAHTSLHFIEHEEQLVLIGKLSQAFQIACRGVS